jgi:hypothetical protein
VGFSDTLVGVADGKAEGMADGANVAVGAGVVAVPQPATNNPASIKSRTREASFRLMRHLLAAAAPRLGLLS